jgi:anti-sigma factor RsiW
MDIRPASCDRVTELVSLALDGELSSFQKAILERHLRRCEECAGYARTVVGATKLLRAAPLEEFRLPDLHVRSRRRVGWVVRSAVATAGVAAAGIWLGLSFSAEAPRTPPPSEAFVNPPSSAVAASNGSRDWPAGLPRVKETIQLIPGGLRNADQSP